MKGLNGTTRAILRRRLTREQERRIASLPESLRLGALWRTLKYRDPWPRQRRRGTNHNPQNLNL
ncbi:MAG: hypothetical protein ACOCVG_02050 [Verrucomicrobiota bacterium]